MTSISHIPLICLLSALGFFISCQDDGPVYGDPQSPVLWMAGGLEVSNTAVDNAFPVEMATVMEFTANGRIDQLCLLVPDNGVYRLTLWDTESWTVLESVSLEVVARQTRCVDIPDRQVAAGDEMAVSVETKDWYEYTDPAHPGHPIFPFTSRDVELLYHAYRIFPEGFEAPEGYDFMHLYGVADIIFEPEL